MRTWVAVLTVLVGVSTGHAALACGDEERPVLSVSDQAELLLSEASRLDSGAATRERDAASLERQADLLVLQARDLRSSLATSGELERPQILARVERIAARGAALRASAAEQRASAATIRARARGLREQATRLIRGDGNRWRGAPATVARADIL